MATLSHHSLYAKRQNFHRTFVRILIPLDLIMMIIVSDTSLPRYGDAANQIDRCVRESFHIQRSRAMAFQMPLPLDLELRHSSCFFPPLLLSLSSLHVIRTSHILFHGQASVFSSCCLSRRRHCIYKSMAGESGSGQLDLAFDLKQLASEKEEAKAVMVQFLKRVGLSTALSTRVTNKACHFITHLISILHSRYRIRYLTGRELTTVEIQKTLLPYLEGLAAEHGDGLVDVLVHFPNPPLLRKEYRKSVTSKGRPRNIKDSQPYGLKVNGNLRPSVSYVLSLGLTLEQVQVLAHKFPSIVHYSPEKKIKPVVDHFLALGVSKSGILKIFLKSPQIFGCSLEENLKPTMVYLESIGVERSKWARILVHFPALLTYGKVKIQESVDFLYQVGLSSTDVGRMITRFPHVVSYSVEGKLDPTVKFLGSIGIKDVCAFLRSSPQVLGYSVEGNIKPTILFLVELGYSKDDVIAMINRYPQVLGLAINENLRPKWDFFLQTGWPKSQILAFPQYFGYSLKTRIKPRVEEVLENDFCWTLNRILSSSESEFQRLLKRERDQLGSFPNSTTIFCSHANISSDLSENG